MFEVYKPSGGFGVSTFLYSLIGMVPAAMLGLVYAYILHYMPYLFFSVAMSVTFGMGLGVIGSVLVRMGHCRNPLLAGSVGMLLGVSGLAAKHYTQYELWLSRTADEFVEMELSDGTIKASEVGAARQEIRSRIATNVSFFDHFKERADEGFVVEGVPITGILIYSIWIIEFGIAVTFSWTTARMVAVKEPYNEQLGMWANETEEAMRLPISNEEMVEQIKSATSVKELLEIPIPTSLNYLYYALYRVHSVPGVELEDAYLSVILCEKSYDKNGNEQVKETELVANAILTSDQRIQLLENASLMNEALEDYRQALAEGVVEEGQSEAEGDN